MHWPPPSHGIVSALLLASWNFSQRLEQVPWGLGLSANIYLCKRCYSNVCLCFICHSLQVSPQWQKSFWLIHLHIGAFQVIFLHENCHEQSISVFRNEKSKTHGWYLSRRRKVSISLLPHLLHSNWRREVSTSRFWSGFFLESNRAKKLPFLLTAD